MIARDWLVIDPSPEIALVAENEALRAQLTAAAKANETLCDYANRGWARAGTLSTRSQRLLRLARYWRAPGRKPQPDREKALMMVRYVDLGGLSRGGGEYAKAQVAHEFAVSISTVNRIVKEFKARLITRPEAIRTVLNYRRRYGL